MAGAGGGAVDPTGPAGMAPMGAPESGAGGSETPPTGPAGADMGDMGPSGSDDGTGGATPSSDAGMPAGEDAGAGNVDGVEDDPTVTAPGGGCEPKPDQPSDSMPNDPPSDSQPYRDGVQMLRVDDGVPVKGAGCNQQWEGIVMTAGGRGLCTAAFITERHLLSASHCYARAGAVSLNVSAPTWDDGAPHAFQAEVSLSGSVQSLDVSVIDLGEPVAWATPERRYVLHAGDASSADLYLYGFGSGGSSGPAGTLRAVADRVTIHVTNNGRGNLNGTAGDAQLCTGDSGGPAFVENTAAILYGINQAIVPSGWGGGRTCADTDWTIMFTNVSEYLPFIEDALGRTCERKRVDDLDVAQCW